MDLHKRLRVLSSTMMPTRKTLTVVELSDQGGQYILALTCDGCGHTQDRPTVDLAAIAGWDVPLAEVIKGLRCSSCGARQSRSTRVNCRYRTA
jgi:hypothetical protein